MNRPLAKMKNLFIKVHIRTVTDKYNLFTSKNLQSKISKINFKFKVTCREF